MIRKELSHFFEGAFKDKRIDKRANKMLESIIGNGSAIVNKCCSSMAEKMGAYRMLNNDKLDVESIGEQLYSNCLKHIKGNHVLCIQDTSEINFTAKRGRIKADDPDVGPVTKDSNLGFYLHPMLAVDAESHQPLGFSAIKMWNRKSNKTGKKSRNYKYQPIETKESYRWIKVARESSSCLPRDVRQTVIADREADVYEAFHALPGERCELFIRSSHNRTLVREGCLLLEKKCNNCLWLIGMR
jgi:hypothetical protein